ncbi:MAG TPA: helix-turn-helix domain-containing protein [Steroidobacteraceae bacterium]|nr:helix-turn-helix domain-containing protein [Steroidobacteraceae bacterium]
MGLSINVPGDAIMTTTANDCAALVSRRLWPHSLRIATRERDFRSRFATLQVGDCSIAELNYDSMVEIDAGVIDCVYLVTICLSGAAETRNGMRRAVSVPGSIIVPSPGRPTRYAIAEDSRNITIRIPRQKLETKARELFYYDAAHPIEFDLESSVSGEFGATFAQLVQHICAVAGAAPAALSRRHIAAGYANMMADLLLELHPHNYSGRRLERSLADTPRHLQRATQFIESALHEIESIEQVAAAVGVTERCLQKSFQRYLRLSPAEFVRERRLSRLRELLLAGERRESIMDLMLSVGINQSGRYSGYYQERFGETPSATRRKAQAHDPGASLRPGHLRQGRPRRTF